MMGHFRLSNLSNQRLKFSLCTYISANGNAHFPVHEISGPTTTNYNK